MRLGVPFIAPRQLGAVESKSGRPILPSVVECTGQSGAHRTLSGARFLSLNSAGDRCRSGSRWRTGHVRCPLPTVGLATCRAQIPLPTVGSADRWLTGQSGAHRTVRGTPDTVRCPISFLKQRRRPLQIWEPLAHRTCPVHTGQSGAPFRPLAWPRVARRFRYRPLARPTVGSPDSPVNFSRTPSANFREWPLHAESAWRTGQSGVPERAESWLYTAKPFAPLFFSFLLLSVSNT
jgi:hypothetical protein